MVPRQPGAIPGEQRSVVGEKAVGRVQRPNGFAVPVDGYTVGPAPRSFLQRELCPIADDAIGVGSAVDGLNFVGLGGPGPLLSLNAGALCGDGDGDRHRDDC